MGRPRENSLAAFAPGLLQVCWYFPDSREQYRISGLLTIVDAHHVDERLQAVRASLITRCGMRT